VAVRAQSADSVFHRAGRVECEDGACLLASVVQWYTVHYQRAAQQLIDATQLCCALGQYSTGLQPHKHPL